MASVNFFVKLFQGICSFHDGRTCPHCIEWSAVFDQNQHDPCPTIHPISLQVTFFLSPGKKVLKEKCFADMQEVKQKTAEALKGIKIDEFKTVQNYFEQFCGKMAL